ncbi:MAG: polysaccharide deacetylase family protein [Eubacteriales bacterium]|nr:polysaccharide deacetylase family protein [Eubacteriales bacterium]
MNQLKKIIHFNVIPFIGRVCLSNNKYCNVIYYHDIVKGEGFSYMRANIDVFKSHMDFIASYGYKTLKFDDLNSDDNVKFGKKKVIIAFDDGWLSNYSEIFEYMKSKNIKYNIFLAVGEIGKNKDYITWDMAREMHESGIVGFGAHTYSHVSMEDLSKVDYNLEVNTANEIIMKELGVQPFDFCYPFGYFSDESNEYLAQSSSYRRLYTSEWMYSYKISNTIIFGRNKIGNDYLVNFFEKVVNGYYNVHTMLHRHIKKL